MIETQDIIALAAMITFAACVGLSVILADRVKRWRSKRRKSIYYRPLYRRLRLPQLRNFYIWPLLILVFGGLGWAGLNYIQFIPGVLGDIMAMLAKAAKTPDQHEQVRSYAYAFAALAGAMALLFTIPFQLIRVWLNERTTQSGEQGLITDRINKAVEGLGAEKTVKNNDEESTVPNIEVRIGAIYALERISKDSERDHIQIMELLCAYIRNNAPATDAADHDLGEWNPPDDMDPTERAAARDNRFGSSAHRNGKLQQWADGLGLPRADIQTALSVIGRRAESRIDTTEARKYRGSERYQLDLRNTNLQSTDLSHLNLRFAQLQSARMQGANLSWARMEGADLSWARMEGANLSEARMEGANLSKARMEGATLLQAGMQGADLSWAWMEGADLSAAWMEGAILSEAWMEGANLSWARMQGANLSAASMEGADLKRARMEGADLKRARMQGSNLSGAWMQGADLTGARMEGAILSETQFSRETIFTATTLRGAALHAVDLSALHVSANQFTETFGDRSVTLPAHWNGHYPQHWAPDPEPLSPFEFADRWREFQVEIDYADPKS